eukprot:CAMPEP_0202789682 /NCGR_PEP_ID=MMETSP1388-20130828/77784_1 /ASSEMBLY_ACC=CAM_ASM_000864 /TAXON_ID=37098 /ORGANISM="Isochrysis sp, Strain CCMP1244" /LENGTH=193 /DNA_ID=CAMNT_0049459375 /DNA_START=44 /DNA_END=622 /DNA_ORIENTATION=-
MSRRGLSPCDPTSSHATSPRRRLAPALPRRLLLAKAAPREPSGAPVRPSAAQPEAVLRQVAVHIDVGHLLAGEQPAVRVGVLGGRRDRVGGGCDEEGWRGAKRRVACAEQVVGPALQRRGALVHAERILVLDDVPVCGAREPGLVRVRPRPRVDGGVGEHGRVERLREAPRSCARGQRRHQVASGGEADRSHR